jgi:hypothetical protein
MVWAAGTAPNPPPASALSLCPSLQLVGCGLGLDIYLTKGCQPCGYFLLTPPTHPNHAERRYEHVCHPDASSSACSGLPVHGCKWSGGRIRPPLPDGAQAHHAAVYSVHVVPAGQLLSDAGRQAHPAKPSAGSSHRGRADAAEGQADRQR